MKSIIYFLLVITFLILGSSCKSQQSKIEVVELPAYQPNNEKEIMKSIYNSAYYKSFQKLIINGNKYPIKDLSRILDTLKIERYNIIVENDSITNSKILILKSS